MAQRCPSISISSAIYPLYRDQYACSPRQRAQCSSYIHGLLLRFPFCPLLVIEANHSILRASVPTRCPYQVLHFQAQAVGLAMLGLFFFDHGPATSVIEIALPPLPFSRLDPCSFKLFLFFLTISQDRLPIRCPALRDLNQRQSGRRQDPRLQDIRR